VAVTALRGEKVRLTALSEDDLPTIARWHEDTEVMRRFDAAVAMPRNVAQLRRWLEEQHARPNAFLFAIRPSEGHGILGYLDIDGILWAHKNAWLALVIGERERWGQGLGREAMRLALWFAFDELNLHRVQLTAFADNERAIRLYEGMGFAREGTLREFLLRDGRRVDMYVYGLLSDVWRAGADG
jgi:RimJ/RimL family protein N-acetyltransferase